MSNLENLAKHDTWVIGSMTPQNIMDLIGQQIDMGFSITFGLTLNGKQRATCYLETEQAIVLLKQLDQDNYFIVSFRYLHNGLQLMIEID